MGKDLLSEAEHTVEEFRNTPIERQNDRSVIAKLVRSFRALEKARKKLREEVGSSSLRLSISEAMLSLNEALRLTPDSGKDRFVELYHFLVVVEPQPDLLEDGALLKEFRKAMVDARQIGLRLCEDAAFQAGLEKAQHLKKHFFARLAKICRAHDHYGCVNPEVLPAISAEAANFEALSRATETRSDELIQALSQVQHSLATRPIDLGECLQGASRLSELFRSGSTQSRLQIARDLAYVFKLMQRERSSADCSAGARLELSRAMLILNETLRSRAVVESGLLRRFDALYEFHECVRFHEELFSDPTILVDLKPAMREAYEIGLQALLDKECMHRLGRDSSRKGRLLSRLGETCRAQAVYDCVGPSELPAILERGISLFQEALKIRDPTIPGHLNFSGPRLAECQMRLGRHAEAIETLKGISNPGHGITPTIAWEARFHLAGCYQALGRTARLAGELQVTQDYFQYAEHWYVQAARVWEPEHNPRFAQCQNEANLTLHGQLAWLYLDWNNPIQAEKQARIFLSIERDPASKIRHNSYLLLTTLNLGTALLRQKGRNAEAIHVFEQLLLQDLAPLHQLRPLIALRQLYAWAGDTEALRNINEALINACNDAGDQRYALILALTKDQQAALLDFEVMADYVRSCNQRLANRDVLSLLKELPIMIAAERLLSPYGREDAVLLSLMGQAYFRTGNFKGALSSFEHVLKLDQSPKNQGITWMFIGNVHLAERRLDEALFAYVSSHASGGMELAPLLKAAKVCRLQRDYDRAFAFLDEIARSGRDDRPFVTKTVRARTLWARFQEAGKDADGRAACRELIEVIRLSQHGDTVAVRFLTQMLKHSLAQSFLSGLLETTTDFTLILKLRHWLVKQAELPLPILYSVIRRLADQRTQVELGQILVGILARFIVRGYFTGKVGGTTFDHFASRVCGLFVNLGPDKRRAWLLELLTAEREAPSAEFRRRYADASLTVLAPILTDSNALPENRYVPEVLVSLNSFLRETMPATVCPTAYVGADRVDLRREIGTLLNITKDELAEEITRGCRMMITSHSTGPAWVSHYQWIKARILIAKLLGIAEGPLRGIASETAAWSIAVFVEGNVLSISFGFEPIDLSRNPARVMARTNSDLREWKGWTTPLKVSWSGADHRNKNRTIIIRVVLPRPRFWPRGFAPLGPITAYLVEESTRILSGLGTDAGFFQKADSLFPSTHASVFEAPVSDWVLFLRCVLDQQFALTADWLMTSARHPRGVIHDLKNEIQIIFGGQQMGREISDQEINRFRDKALNAVAQMDRMLRSEIFRGYSLLIDAGAVVTRFIDSIGPQLVGVELRIDLEPEVYVEIHPRLFDSVVLNLLHNAFAAATISGIAPWISITLLRIDTEAGGHPQMFLKVANPYDPTKGGTPAGTGIGLLAVRHIIEKLNDGHVFEIPNEDSRVYEVGLVLRLAGAD